MILFSNGKKKSSDVNSIWRITDDTMGFISSSAPCSDTIIMIWQIYRTTFITCINLQIVTLYQNILL